VGSNPGTLENGGGSAAMTFESVFPTTWAWFDLS
jgi:hypothetical protein